MKHRIQDLIDVEQLQSIQDRLSAIYPFPCALVDNDGEILTATAWQDICTDFHRRNKACEKECIKSDQYILDHLSEANPAVSYRCPHGLNDNAMPIFVDGEHLANFFTGQFFLEEPDMEFFRKQAEKYGFDTDSYMRAVERVPVWSQEQLNSFLLFMKELIDVMTSTALNRLSEIEAAKILAVSEQRYSWLFQHSGDYVLILKLQDNAPPIIVDANSATLTRHGYAREELIGKPITLIDTPESMEHVGEWLDLLASRKAVTFEVEHLCKDGSTFLAESSATLLMHDDEQYILAVERDITERKKAAEALRQSEVLQSKMVANIGDVIVIIDKNGINRYKSVNVEKWFGWQPEDLLGVETLDNVHPDDKAAASELLLSLMNTPNATGTIECRYRCKDGSYKWIEFTGKNLLSDPDIQGVLGNYRDITERIERDAHIKKQQHYLEKSQELGNIGTWEVSLIDGDSFWSKESCRIFGVPEGTACSFELCISRMHPDDREYVTQEWSQALKGKRYDIEHRILVDDKVRWVREKADFEFDREGNAVSALGFTQDITDQREAREDLRAALAEFRTLTEASPTAIYRTDTKGNCTYVNQRWLDMAGMKLDEALGQGWVAAIHPDDRAEMLRTWRECVESEGAEWNHVYRFVNKNGNETTVLGTESPIRDVDGNVVGYIGSNLDISERAKWEEQIADVARFPEENKAPVIRFSAEGVVLYANPAARELLRSDCWGADVGAMMSRESFSEISHIYESGRSTMISRECQGRHYDIEVVPVPERGYVNLYCRDVTDQAAAEAALREANKRAIAQARLSALGQMASGIAHDFNNALMPIIGFTDLLLEKPEEYLKEKDEMVSMLQQILDAAGDARQIVQRLRLVHRQDVEEERQNLHLNDLIESSVHLTQPRWKEQKSAEGHPVKLTTTLTKTSRPIKGNESELREMMMNLIMNAVDAMPLGGTIDIQTTVQPDYIQLNIVDSGEGMSEETLEKCLEPFYTTKGAQGTGLGLAMVHGIVERHNGTMEIRSKQGEGTSISIMLPYAARGERGRGSSSIEAAEPIAPLRVIVVDDEERSLRLTMRLLAKDHHIATSMTSSSEAMAMLEERASEFDVLISDRAMPEVNGDDLIRVAKTVNPDIATILLTGFGSIMHDEGEMPEGTDKVLGKPITLNEFRAAIREVVEMRDS